MAKQIKTAVDLDVTQTAAVNLGVKEQVPKRDGRQAEMHEHARALAYHTVWSVLGATMIACHDVPSKKGQQQSTGLCARGSASKAICSAWVHPSLPKALCVAMMGQVRINLS